MLEVLWSCSKSPSQSKFQVCYVSESQGLPGTQAKQAHIKQP